MKELESMRRDYEGLTMTTKDFNQDETAIIVVDMINGFVYEGNFASDRVKVMAPNIAALLDKFKDSRKVFFRDIHTEDSKEFNAYIDHCVDEKETRVIDILESYAKGENSVEIAKNSTNGFITEGFGKWLDENSDVKNFIVVGCVTDICVSDFAKTLQCYIYENNLDKNVFLPRNCVETYDLGSHNGEMMNVFALYSMKLGGIKVLDEII